MAQCMKRCANSLLIREMWRDAHLKQRHASPHPTEWHRFQRWIISDVGRRDSCVLQVKRHTNTNTPQDTMSTTPDDNIA